MTPVIEVENLSKMYYLGVIGSTTFRDSLERWWSRLRGREDSLSKIGTGNLMIDPDDPQAGPEPNTMWALKDVSFSVRQGEVLGVIGRNGAGKSTLLKLLTRITDPTGGRAVMRGRVASLLEVGTGFHPELTGRENTFLNGAILGMRKNEVAAKFDEIVSFAGVEKFIDTPVKRYSSGMYVRLAFAVAAHLEPEILLVDEVLAVGDADFQRRCIGKMKSVAAGGRTVLFVSHNMRAVEQLCTSAMIISKGAVQVHSDNVERVVAEYLGGDTGQVRPTVWEDEDEKLASSYFAARKFALTDGEGRPVDRPMNSDADITVEVHGNVLEVHPSFAVGYAVYAEDNTRLYSALYTDAKYEKDDVPQKGRAVFRSQLPRNLLNAGRYRIALIAGLNKREWFIHPERNAPNLWIDIKGVASRSPFWNVSRPGVIAPHTDWVIEGGSGE